MIKIWTKGEENFLKAHYREMTCAELGEKFSVSASSVRKKEKALGLVRKHPSARSNKKKKELPRPARKWIVTEEIYLQKYYLDKTNAELAKKFQTTPKSIEKKLFRMGLRRRVTNFSLADKERERRIEEFLRESRASSEEKKIDPRRLQAITRFEEAVKFYYAKDYQQAENSFRALITDFAMFQDIVYKAKQYLEFCRKKI